MKKLQYVGVVTVFFTSLAISFAAPQLRLSDGTTTVTVADGDPNDQAPDPGMVYYNGPVGSTWNVNITIGVTTPAIGSAAEPFMDLDTESLSTKAGNLDIQYTDTGYTAPSGTFDAEVGGLTDGSVEFKYYLDGSNTPFGHAYVLADFANQVDVYASSSNGNYTISAPYSMTVEAIIHHNGKGATGFDESLQLIPPQFQPPTIQCPGDQDLGCNPATIPGCDTSSVVPTADCGVSNVTCAVAGPDIVTGCVHERDLVYTVTDNCGQTASCTQHLYWTVDTTGPSFTQCPGDTDLGCNPTTVPDCDLTQVAATDDCGKAVITCSSSDATNGCSHSRTITYTATDKCGNSSTCVQHITWTADTTAPQFTNCPGDQDLGCNPLFIPDCSNTPTASATDNCGIPTVSCINSDTNTGCSYTRTITYIATDTCGNTATCVRHITWTADTTPPTINCPAGLNLEANDPVPAPDVNSVSASDNCGSATVSYSGATTNAGCPIVITRTYKATDACGNTATCSQLITIDCPPACTGVSNAITSNFNGTSINPTNYIWFSANLSATGIPSTGTIIYVKSQTVKIVSANGTFTYNIPNGKIIFSPSATCSTTMFDGTQWVTTVPITGSDEIFFAGLGVKVGVDVKAANPVTWGGIFTADNKGVAIKWKWSAAVYKTDMSQAQYNNLGVKPSHTSACSYANSDHAGTPENKKTYVTGGARGGGGSDWTGSWSGTGAVTLCP